MKKTAFKKSSLRAVKSSITRFISIILISFLGSTIFSGLLAVSPNMKLAGDIYYDRQNIMDVRMLSTYGFTQDDVKAIKDTNGVLGVMASYTIDVTGFVDEDDYTLRINGLSKTSNETDDNYINRLDFVEGGLPKKDDEAVIILPSTGLKNIKIGSKVVLDEDSNDSFSDIIGRTNYKIVGIANSPNYMSFMQGNTSIGDGMINYVLYVPQNNFVTDGYTDIYVTVDNAKDYNSFENEYLNNVETTIKNLEKLASERQSLRYDDLNSKLTDAKNEYEDGKKESDQKLFDAQLKIDDAIKTINDAKEQHNFGLSEYNTQKSQAEQKLSEAKIKLDDAQKEVANGENQINSNKKKLNLGKLQLESARDKIDSGWNEYFLNLKELQSGKTELEKNKILLVDAQNQLDKNIKAAESAMNMPIEQIEKALPSIKAQIDSSKEQLNNIKSLKALKEQRDSYTEGSEQYIILNSKYEAALKQADLTEEKAELLYMQISFMQQQISDSEEQYLQLIELISGKNDLAQKWVEYNFALTQIDDGEKKLMSAKKTLNESKSEYKTKLAELNDGFNKLEQAQSEIELAKNTLSSGIAQYNTQKAEAKTKLDDAKTKLDDAAKQIKDGEKEISNNQKLLDDKKLEAKSELDDADKKIKDSEKKLSDMGTPKWYVLNREMNESFAAFNQDTRRMANLATVFPIIFFLVAVLVCLTTMTRMVDEDRTLIGTFKALGYSNISIAGRYLKYASSASVIGSILGVILGFWLLPTIVWNAYKMVYMLPDMTPQIYLNIAFLSVFTTVFIITASTALTLRKTLRETPAQLMRPKAPKSGKRVLLEYIKPLWNRFSFTHKVTVRNLALNKKRLIMTLIGVLGCTALVVTAFGAKNAVEVMLDKQFVEIFHYDLTVGFNGTKPSHELFEHLSNKSYFKQSTQILRKTAEATLKDNNDKNYSVYIVSPQESGSLQDYISLIDPKSKKDIDFNDNSVIITEKLSLELNVGAGDTIMLNYLEEDEQYQVTITAVAKNYTFNFAYLGKSAFEKVFGESPKYNQFLTITSDKYTEDEVKEYLSSVDEIGSVAFTGNLMGNLSTSIKSINSIVWIMVIAAGLLAFVVLYNLININVSERERELATLKVLGFYDKETYNYIFRETIILSIIGTAIGLVAGIFLYQMVVTTVEPDMIMLTRDLTWQGFVGASILSMLFTLIVNQFMKPKIKRIDMLESMKSVD